MVLRLLLTLLTAFCGGWVLWKIKVPGGMLVGAIIGSAILNILTGNAFMTVSAKVLAQIAAGAFIGCLVKREDIYQMRRLLKPAAINLSCMLMLNLLVGFLIWKINSRLDMVTALFSAVPGGISDIPIIAEDMGANAPQVAVMQFIRLLVGIGIFPGLIQWVTRKESVQVIQNTSQQGSQPKILRSEYIVPVIRTVAVASVSGLIGKIFGIPAGTLVFAMIGVIILKFKGILTYLPMWMKRFAQLLSGAYIGCGLNYQDILEMRYLALPMVVLLIGYTVNCFLAGELLHRFCGISRREGMLAATPAGATDMALISADLGINSPDLVILQIIRLTVVISVFPSIIHLIILYITSCYFS